MAIDFNIIPSPCFVLDENLLIENLELIRTVQETAGVEIILALKGYALWETFPLIKKYLRGATASSLNEAKLINEKMGCKAHTYAPIYTAQEFCEILDLSTHLTFNSLSQYERFKDHVVKGTQKASFGIRINPEYSEVGTALYNPGSFDSRLGVKSEELGENLPEGIDGLHFHLLCENDSYVLERTLKVVEEKFGHLLKKIRWFNMGGGHLMTHKDYDTGHLVDLLRAFKSKYKNIENIILEPGGAIGWRTGYLVTTVEDIIERSDMTIAMLDVSFAAHMPDCLEMPYKPHILGATDYLQGQKKYRLGGNTCLSGDFMGMGDYSFERELKVGDRIVFEDMMHYTMVKTTFFNGVKHPSIGKWTMGNTFELLKNFTYEEYRNKLS
ncbi:MAG: carboxynorspermidine decarboxylase [Bacteroidales bacterium]|nr:carboxynorspermidine decarboxylase [Bacteroidales bacterium]